MIDLIHDIEVLGVRGDPAATAVRSVELDSRRVRPGSLFCCVPGAHTDGHRHAPEAVANGAGSLLCERFLDLDVTQVCVAPGQVRPAMAGIAASFYDHPSRSMAMVGVTGTNGKTTVTHLVRSMLDHAGWPTATIGTLDGERTTPEAPVLQGLLAGARDEGRTAVAMEVSSHALTQHRVDGIVFDVAAFTNLSRDHLDHHGSMEAYFGAKARLFGADRARAAVIAVDDAWGRRLADGLAAAGRPAVEEVRRSDASDVVLTVGTSRFRWRGRDVTVPLSGAFNVDNALVALTVVVTLGIDEDLAIEGLGSASAVPGRMEVVSEGQPFAVVVDYAHTPAGLDGALSTAKALAGDGRVLTVFGAGGDRDQGKRPLMGHAAARWSDVVVLTSDNPRSEDPMAIIDQVRAGIDLARTGADPSGARTMELVVEPDRASAIRAAVDRALPGDVVVVAGKGHETTQALADGVIPFDDREEARRAIDERGPHGDGIGGHDR
jgi:UDP-N-acetylmuramoyl-L-alanyl-D-glutamate--2,6-diaminopimelate ligase